jgi:pheromone shutdown protein TraB
MPAGQRDPEAVADRELERQGRRMGHSAIWFLLVGIAIAIPGVVLIVLKHYWSIGVGIAVCLIASVPLTIGVGLLVSGAVSRWASRRKSFA